MKDMLNPNCLAGACDTCEKRAPHQLYCGVLGVKIHAHLLSGAAFCPLGKHEGCGAVESLAPWRPSRNVWIRTKQTVRRTIAGAASLLTWVLWLCPVDGATSRVRRDLCRDCEYRKRIGPMSVCGICHCLIRAKTGLADEACPVGKWSAVESGSCVKRDRLPIVGKYLRTSCGGCGGKKA